jgi:hypothetical protein
MVKPYIIVFQMGGLRAQLVVGQVLIGKPNRLIAGVRNSCLSDVGSFFWAELAKAEAAAIVNKKYFIFKDKITANHTENLNVFGSQPRYLSTNQIKKKCLKVINPRHLGIYFIKLCFTFPRFKRR